MNLFHINNKEYLLSIRPKYFYLIIITCSIFIMIITSIFFVRTYDMYSVKALYSCEEDCHLYITISPEISDKFANISYLRLKNNNIKPDLTNISTVQLDTSTKSNYQLVDYKVARQDGLENTYQDITIFYNYEEVVKKITKFILK